MAQENSINYDQESAASYAGFTDAFAPVAQAILDRLPALAPHSRIVDLACGPGEPGLSVLERYAEAELLGIDTSQDMLALARARTTGRTNVRFAQMDMRELDIPSDSIDAIVSRFGFLTLEDVSRSAAEFARIARPGCAFSIAVWDRLELNTVASSSIESLRGLTDDALLPPLDELDTRAARALPQHTLTQVGVTELHTELFSWSTPVDGFGQLWSMLTGPGIWQPAVSTLDADTVTELRRRYAARFEEYTTADGTYLIPSTCRLLWGLT
ncbi:class I SAM-dependent methyltransferase [Nocardia jiangxiensis]|uniref:Class I SAM-dependent methyltransferase n=1 Tax=Nocardia jiangxiensis TaxID=282685 RepID=A0ABW6S7F1_9NOCA|nr:class I SAM-dependent methyltransferase [Nocardia jiangxiensis]